MDGRPFVFEPCRPRIWTGRYARVPGGASTLHIRRTGSGWWPFVEWVRWEGTGQCWMLGGADVDALVAAVQRGKRALGARPGGSFLVNEFGQVLVPADGGDGTRVVIVGECDGRFLFATPFDDHEVIDLADSTGLRTGDPWERPYVGMPHFLDGSGRIACRQAHEYGTGVVSPPVQDRRLIAALRTLRPEGGRFLVGVGGVVLTKVPTDWEPRFVGRIDPARWFPKEG